MSVLLKYRLELSADQNTTSLKSKPRVVNEGPHSKGASLTRVDVTPLQVVSLIPGLPVFMNWQSSMASSSWQPPAAMASTRISANARIHCRPVRSLIGSSLRGRVSKAIYLGMQGYWYCGPQRERWVPAFAGMTGGARNRRSGAWNNGWHPHPLSKGEGILWLALRDWLHSEFKIPAFAGRG